MTCATAAVNSNECHATSIIPLEVMLAPQQKLYIEHDLNNFFYRKI